MKSIGFTVKHRIESSIRDRMMHNSINDIPISDAGCFSPNERVEVFVSDEDYDKMFPKQFELGAEYIWDREKCYGGESPGHQGKRHGNLRCVFVGDRQGVFVQEQWDGRLEESAVFENTYGLHTIAVGHLRSGAFNKVEK